MSTLAFVVFHTSAASFDCSRAAYPIERLICSTPETSKADTELSKSYKLALSVIGEPLKESQRVWLKERNKAESSNELLRIYNIRIAYLDGLKPGEEIPRLSHENSSNEKIETVYRKYLDDSVEAREDCLANTIGVLGTCEEMLKDMEDFKKNHQHYQKSSPLLFNDLTAKINATKKKVEELKVAEKESNLYDERKSKCNQNAADIASKEDEDTILVCIRESFDNSNNNANLAMMLFTAYKESGRSTSSFEEAFIHEYNNNLKTILMALKNSITTKDRRNDDSKFNLYAPQKRSIYITTKFDGGYKGYILGENRRRECISLKGYSFDLSKQGEYFIWSFISDEKSEIMSESGDIENCKVLVFSPNKPEYTDLFKETHIYKEHQKADEQLKEKTDLYNEGVEISNQNDIVKSQEIYRKAMDVLQYI